MENDTLPHVPLSCGERSVCVCKGEVEGLQVSRAEAGRLRTGSVHISISYWIDASSGFLQKYISGWGPGGQKVNTAQNAVQLRHIPTGLVVKVHESRLLPKNIDIAFERMKHVLDRHVNGDNCYEEQYKRLQREKEAKAKKKREMQRKMRKELEEDAKKPASDQ
ncbi:hypothetical protein ANCCEY_06015 [Ancylostoma ceylanicum]|uniref:Prokaryotic-type class I peptide chain release factors domain-containing protein n=1 Tax=Ancylostoma ceylanicum TaxID=53326 RepID=A0A0D6LSR1_9BILA|nr:hypothetical protein ANCCEY_06015 [Ancylostoma ceylanicum]